MTANGRLLVVTPTLGRSPWLDRAVASVAAYAGASAMHVLVTPTEFQPMLRRRFPECEVVADHVARGVYPAINLGLQHARGRAWSWFTWLNDDDQLEPGFAPHLARTLACDGRDPGAPWAYGQVRLRNGAGKDLGGLAVARSAADLIPLVQSGISPLNQQGLLAPRVWVERLGQLREEFRICADLDFWLRAASAGARFECSPEIVAVFRLRAGQISGDVPRHVEEFSQVVRIAAPSSHGGLRRFVARARFRLGNAAVYAGRVRHSGWRGGLALLQQPVRKPT